MDRLFSKIGARIEKTPFKTLLLSILIFAIMIAGAIKVNMATGSETLVKTDNDAYISNYDMEENFGGDAIIVLFEGEEEELLKQGNMEKMWNVEQRLKYNEDIFSFMSPASIVHQITEKQTNMIKENVLTMGSGLNEMSSKLIEIGKELGNKDVPDPKEMEDKLNSMIAEMNPDGIMDEVLGKQKVELEKKMLPMSDGLGQMGGKLANIGNELGSKDIPNPNAIEEKLNGLTDMLGPNSPIFKSMEEDTVKMKEDIQRMGQGLGEMGSKLREIGNGLGSMDAPNPEGIEKTLVELSNITNVFDELAKGQNNMGNGAVGLKEGLTNSSQGLGSLSSQLKQMASQIEDEELRSQLDIIAGKVGESSAALSEMSGNTNMISEGSKNTSNALSNISKELEQKLSEMKEGLSGGVSPDKLEEMSIGLASMGKSLEQMSNKLANADSMLPDSSSALVDMQSKMEQELAEMKANLSGGISPDELKTMSGGFVTMGENLNMLSNGLSTMIQGGDMLPDSSEALSGMTSRIETEIGEMKANLSGGMSPEDLKTMSEGFVTMGENLSKLGDGLGTFHDKSGMLIANFPHNQAELDNILYEDGKLRSIFEDTVLDENHTMMMIKLVGNLEDDAKDVIYAEVVHAMEKEGFEDINYIISGKPVLDSSLRTEMKSNMQYMVAFAVIVMFLILNLVFKVRWRVLSLGIIFVSVIATLGLMGHLSVSMTMVSMAVFPILIGLGIDYSIQFHNRYEEEKSVKITLTQIGKAVGIAVLATVLGFISLYASPVPMIQDFGKMLTIGVIVSFIGSIFLLMPILNTRDIFNDKTSKKDSKTIEKQGLMDKFLDGTSKFVTKSAPVVLIVAIVLAGFGLVADSKVGVETDIETFMPQDMDALHDIHYVRDVVGSTNQMVIYMEGEDLLSQDNISWMKDTIKDIEGKFSNKIIDIKSIDNLVSNFSENEELSFAEYIDIIDQVPESQRKMFINESKDKGVILMNIKHMATEELQDFVKDIQKLIKDAPMDVSITGKSVLDVEMVKGLTDGRVKMTIIGIGLVFVALLLVYRSFFKALIPVFPIILIVGMSGGIMNLLGLKYTPITATLGALVLGMGTEMTIMLLERYLEERNSGKGKEEAMSITINRIGKATVASGLTTVGGFSVLMLSKFVILKDFGLMTVINISLALMSTFIILPALIWVLDKFIVDKKVREEAYKRLYQE